MERLQDWLEQQGWPVILTGVVVYLGGLYVLLSVFNIQSNLMGLGWLFNPLGITLATAAALLAGIIGGLLKETLS